jgi:hypothetical protein
MGRFAGRRGEDARSLETRPGRLPTAADGGAMASLLGGVQPGRARLATSRQAARQA